MTAVRRGATLLATASLLAVGSIVASPLAPTVRAGLLVTANDDAYGGVHDRVLAVAAPGLLANDTGVAPTAAKTSNPGHGSVTVNPNGSFTYQPNAGYIGTDTFGYEARVLSLGVLLTDPATVTLTITDAAPTAVDDSFAATTGVALSVPAPGVMGNDSDPDGDALTAVLVDGSGNGSLSLASDGSFSFTSGGSFTGVRQFTYRVTDGIRSSNLGTVAITVSAAPPTPTPAPTPTPRPTATPPPTPGPTRPPPSLPLPSLPDASLPLPSLPSLPPPTLPGAPTSAPTPGAVGSAATSAGPDASDGPDRQPAAGGPAAGDPGGPPTSGAGSSRSGSPSAGGGPGGDATGFVVGASGDGSLDGLATVDLGGFGGVIDWVVPSLVLSVPGLLIVIAVAAQLIGGVAWVPLVHRWLGEFGVVRRRRRDEVATRP